MKPIWLIEIEIKVWKDDNVQRMIGILRELGLTVYAQQHSPFAAAEFEVVDEDCPIIYYGTLNTLDSLRVSRPNWVPLVWFDREAFSCRSYYAHWGKYLLQEHYGFYPFGELLRLKDRLYQTYGKEGLLFIRPDDNDKRFSGRLVPEDNFLEWHEEIQAGKPDPALLVVVSAPVRMGGEWRFVVADRKVIAGSHYKWSGTETPSSDDLQTAGRLAAAVAAEFWQPRPIYCVDVTRTGDGQYRLVEIGAVNCAGLYHCELRPVIQAMNEIAIQDFRYWRGRT